jgi:hypothetical protein
MVSTLTEFGRLAAHRPAAGSPIEAVAAWYGEKSRLHMRLAAEAATDDETTHELEHAMVALRHADRLRATASIDKTVLAPVEGVAA